MNIRSTLALATFVLFFACTSPRSKLPDIANIYKEAALDEIRNPVVVLHGVLGARLVDSENGKTVWGAFTNKSYDPNTPEGTRAMCLSLDVPASASDYDKDKFRVRPSGPLDKLEVSFLFQIIPVQVYANILRTLGLGGYTDPIGVSRQTPQYRDDHYTCFTFFYDWRRDNVENAIYLGRWLKVQKKDIYRRAGNKIKDLRDPLDAKTKKAKDAEQLARDAQHAAELEAWLEKGFRFDIVAHSMGGLVARYYLRYGEQDLPKDGSEPRVTWAGAEHIDRLILVAPPNFGSIEMLRNLTRGFRPAFILPNFHQGVLGTMPSLYQLLPRRRHGVVLDGNRQPSAVDLMDVEVWDENNWGLVDRSSDQTLEWLLPDVKDRATRRAKARTYLAWCLQRAKQFHAALDKKPDSPCPTEMYLFAADTERTLTRTVLRERHGKLVVTFPDNDALYAPGDATVPRYSAVADERMGKPYTRGLQSNIPWRNVTFLADDHIGLTMNPVFSDNMLHILLEQVPRAR